MNIAFASVLTKHHKEKVKQIYSMMFEVMLHSFVKHHKDFFPHWYVFSDGSIDEETQERLKSIYGHLIFVTVNMEKYVHYGKTNAKFFIFEAFGLIKYDKVLCLDSDLLFNGNIENLLKINCEFGAHKEIHRTSFNSGVLLLGKKILSGGMTDILLKTDLQTAKKMYFGNDQAILNYYFQERFFEIGYQYNCFADDVKIYGGADGINIIHYYTKPFTDQSFHDRITPEVKELWLNL